MTKLLLDFDVTSWIIVSNYKLYSFKFMTERNEYIGLGQLLSTGKNLPSVKGEQMPITFDALGERLFEAGWGVNPTWSTPGKKGVMGAHFSRLNVREGDNRRCVPVIGAEADPFYVDRGHTKVILFETSGLMTHRVGEHTLKEGKLIGSGFRAYNIPAADLADSTFTEDIHQINPGSVLVAADINHATRIGSWIVDPSVRERITEYADLPDGLDRYIMLREAPFNTYDVPGYGRYTYNGVKQEATKQTVRHYDMGTKAMVDVPVTFRMFTTEHLAWLEEYMNNKGIPIPGEV